MNAEILSVGTELLMGQIANTDAQYLSRELPQVGVYVYRHTVVGDNPQRLKQAVREALQRTDILFTTGGLGPTQDDLTKQTIAELLGLPLELHEPTQALLEDFFSKTGREMTPNNLQQAYFPRGCTVLRNDAGTAPGCAIVHEGKVIIILPGPPRELQWMYQHVVKPYLSQYTSVQLHSRMLRFQGIGESTLAYRIRDLIEAQQNPTVAPYVGNGEVTLRLTAAGDAAAAQVLLDGLQEQILQRLGEYFITDRYASLPETVVRTMAEKQVTLAVAESCTGGLICNKLVEIAGASQVLKLGLVTYANEAKVQQLGVCEETLAQYGAVSEQTAREMAEGALQRGNADYALATTGIAGPQGGSEEKPVGLVYIALAQRGRETRVRREVFPRDRNTVRNQAAVTALAMLFRSLDA